MMTLWVYIDPTHEAELTPPTWGYAYDHRRQGELEGIRWVLVYFGAKFTPQIPIEHYYTTLKFLATHSQLDSLLLIVLTHYF